MHRVEIAAYAGEKINVCFTDCFGKRSIFANRDFINGFSQFYRAQLEHLLLFLVVLIGAFFMDYRLPARKPCFLNILDLTVYITAYIIPISM